MTSPRSTQMSERPWKTAVGLNAFMSSMTEYDTIYPDREVLDRISRLGVDGVEHISYVHLTDTDGTQRPGGSTRHLGCGDGYIDLESSYRTLLDGGFRGWMMVDAWAIPDVYHAFEKGISSIQSFLHQQVTPPSHVAQRRRTH